MSDSTRRGDATDTLLFAPETCNEPLGKPCELVCEKGPNIVVCGDCWDEAIDEERIDGELIEGLYEAAPENSPYRGIEEKEAFPAAAAFAHRLDAIFFNPNSR